MTTLPKCFIGSYVKNGDSIKPEKVLESDDCKIMWDFPIETDKTIKHNQPDITVVDKKSKKCLLIVQKGKTKKNAQIIVC